VSTGKSVGGLWELAGVEAKTEKVVEVLVLRAAGVGVRM
jgi:hypothetical protein